MMNRAGYRPSVSRWDFAHCQKVFLQRPKQMTSICSKLSITLRMISLGREVMVVEGAVVEEEGEMASVGNESATGDGMVRFESSSFESVVPFGVIY